MLSQNNNALGIIFPNSYDNTVERLRSIQFQEINIRENSSRILGLYINL